MTACAADGCDRKAYRTHGVCRTHYAAEHAARRCVDCGVGLYNVKERCGSCYAASRASRGPTWILADRATDYRLRISAAEAKVRQALAIRQHPDTVFPATVEECLYAALAELDLP